MQPLSSLDASFLYIENEFNHMHVAVVAIFEGPPPRGEEIEYMISAKLNRVPRYRQKVRFVPLEIGRPVWSDDHHFNIKYHVRHSALPAPGSDEQLHTFVGRVMSQQLDRAKPLWEIWVVEGLEEGRWAILTKTHHCMVDGVSGSDLLSVLLDNARDAEYPPAVSWEPEDTPSGRSLLLNSLAAGFRTAVESIETMLDRPSGSRSCSSRSCRADRRIVHIRDACQGRTQVVAQWSHWSPSSLVSGQHNDRGCDEDSKDARRHPQRRRAHRDQSGLSRAHAFAK